MSHRDPDTARRIARVARAAEVRIRTVEAYLRGEPIHPGQELAIRAAWRAITDDSVTPLRFGT